jgi:hypothetical protein
MLTIPQWSPCRWIVHSYHHGSKKSKTWFWYIIVVLKNLKKIKLSNQKICHFFCDFFNENCMFFLLKNWNYQHQWFFYYDLFSFFKDQELAVFLLWNILKIRNNRSLKIQMITQRLITSFFEKSSQDQTAPWNGIGNYIKDQISLVFDY